MASDDEWAALLSFCASFLLLPRPGLSPALACLLPPNRPVLSLARLCESSHALMPAFTFMPSPPLLLASTGLETGAVALCSAELDAAVFDLGPEAPEEELPPAPVIIGAAEGTDCAVEDAAAGGTGPRGAEAAVDV